MVMNGSSGAAPAPAFEPNHELVGKSKALEAVVSFAKRYARKHQTILIGGETGTGKRLLAEQIHKASAVTGNFVHVNCAAIPESLFESELFGAKRGAYTSAPTQGKRGFFEAAGNGTLFLDELGEVPYFVQGKLLTALDGEFYPLGGLEPLPMTARIIVATNKDLKLATKKKEGEEGRFREDLYYRVAVLKIKMPSLGERQEDILPLIQFFCRREGCTFVMPDSSASSVERLLSYSWPGNVRELENVVSRATAGLEEETGTVTVDDILNAIEYPADDDSATAVSDPFRKANGDFFTFEELKSHYVRTVWESLQKKSASGFAKAIGVERRTASRLLRSMKLKE